MRSRCERGCQRADLVLSYTKDSIPESIGHPPCLVCSESKNLGDATAVAPASAAAQVRPADRSIIECCCHSFANFSLLTTHAAAS